MDMYDDTLEGREVLCGASAYEEKFYFNPKFSKLPKNIQDELKITCVLFTADVGGILTMEFEKDGTLELVTRSKESDFAYDEIGAHLKIKEMRQKKAELLEELELFYKVLVLGQNPQDSEE